MKTVTLFFTFLIAAMQLTAQDYQISFAGTGASTSVETVEVHNLTQDTYLTLSGSDILHLVAIVGIDEMTVSDNSLNIYPNPAKEDCYLEFRTKSSELVSIEIFDISGRSISSLQKEVLKGINRFSISNLKSGIYTVNLKFANYQKSKILISQNNILSVIPKIHYMENKSSVFKSAKDIQSIDNLVEMQYNDGDRLLLKGISGDYSTIKSIIPTATTTEAFEFSACTDIDDNNYSTVVIGSQVWMAEDLRTTHYPNGDPIPNITDNTDWENLDNTNIDDAYCFQDNNSNSEYGALYTYASAIADNWERDNNPGQGVCPDGWHLPDNDEWEILRDFLGGEYSAGGKMKETTTIHWDEPNAGADNSSGFTALPGGQRTDGGTFMQIGYMAWWWMSTEANSSAAFCFCLEADYPDAGITNRMKSRGYSVRCIKD